MDASDKTSSSGDLQQVLSDISKSMAREEDALTALVNLEGRLTGKMKNSDNPDGLLALNQSIEKIVRDITRLQMLVQIRLWDIQEMFGKQETENNMNDGEE